jgi:hypothetical protein
MSFTFRFETLRGFAGPVSTASSSGSLCTLDLVSCAASSRSLRCGPCGELLSAGKWMMA